MWADVLEMHVMVAPCFLLTSGNDSFGRKCACRQASGRALIPWLDLLLNPTVWMGGTDLAHLRWGRADALLPMGCSEVIKNSITAIQRQT